MDSVDRALLQCSLELHGSELLDAIREEQGESFLLASDTNNSVLIAPFILPQPPSLPPSTEIQELFRHETNGADEAADESEKSTINKLRRKMLVSFIAKKADMLFCKVEIRASPPVFNELEYKDHYGIVPPLEYFMDVNEEARKMHFYQNLCKGDIIVGSILGKHTHGLIILLLCLSSGKMLYIHDLGLRCFCNVSQIPLRSSHEDPLESFDINDLIQGVILDVQPLAQKIYISMKDSSLLSELHPKCKLGSVTEENLPVHYRECVSAGSKRYSEILEGAHGFLNPNAVSHMCLMLGLDLSSSPSLMRGLHQKIYPKEDYASNLYKVQCARWAYKSVEQGVRYFKSGNKVEAFQCLNKALQIDPYNVEALVARGALFANNSSFKRALEDFYKALDQNPKHANALKFTVETLIALAKQYEEQNNSTKVVQCYQKALHLNPSHAEATERLNAFRDKIQGLERDEKARQIELEAESLAASTRKSCDTKQKLKQLLSSEKTGKQEHRNTKRRNSSSSSDLSESSRSHRRSRQHQRKHSSTSSNQSSTISRSPYRSRSRSYRRNDKRKRKTRHRSRRHEKNYRKKVKGRRTSSTTTTSSSSSSSSTSTSSGSSSGDDNQRHVKGVSLKSTSEIKSCVLGIEHQSHVQLPKSLPPKFQQTTNSINASTCGREKASMADGPSTSLGSTVQTLDDLNCSKERQIESDKPATDADNPSSENGDKGCGKSTGQTLAELELFLAELKAKKTKRISK